MIAYFARDLIWASRIKSAAEELGFAARPVRSVEMLDARLADSPVRGLVLDLDEPETALALVRRLRDSEAARGGGGRIRVVAFGPHVETGALREAGAAGADRVMTRGQFHHQMGEALRWVWGEGSSSAGPLD